MRSFNIGVALSTFALACTVSTTSYAADGCMTLAAAGDGLTKDMAVMMSTHGLENIINSKGLKAQGAVKTTCVPGAVLTECRSSQKACK